jgi:hypothetical protein
MTWALSLTVAVLVATLFLARLIANGAAAGDLLVLCAAVWAIAMAIYRATDDGDAP